jgi:hypothetical protein
MEGRKKWEIGFGVVFGEVRTADFELKIHPPLSINNII